MGVVDKAPLKCFQNIGINSIEINEHFIAHGSLRQFDS